MRILLVALASLVWCVAILRAAENADVLSRDLEGEFEFANQAFGCGRYEEAEVGYRKVAHSGVPGLGANGMFNLGLCLKHQARYRDAIRTFRQFFAHEYDDDAPGAHIMEPYRNGRPRALWEIGHCERLQGNYSAALKTYRRVQNKHPFKSWCGNEQAAYEYAYAFYSAICLEGLGRTDEAVREYFHACMTGTLFHFDPAAHLRLIELYESADQVRDLLKVLDEVDEAHSNAARAAVANYGGTFDEKVWKESSPAYPLRQIVDLHSAAATGARSELIKPLLSDGVRRNCPDRVDHWLAIEAARLLARTPKESTRELISAAEESTTGPGEWIPYALGRCATPDGVAWLRNRAMSGSPGYSACAYALSLAGEQATSFSTSYRKFGARMFVSGFWKIGTPTPRNGLQLSIRRCEPQHVCPESCRRSRQHPGAESAGTGKPALLRLGRERRFDSSIRGKNGADAVFPMAARHGFEP